MLQVISAINVTSIIIIIIIIIIKKRKLDFSVDSSMRSMILARCFLLLFIRDETSLH